MTTGFLFILLALFSLDEAHTSLLKKNRAAPYTMDTCCQYVYDVGANHWHVQCTNFTLNTTSSVRRTRSTCTSWQ